MRKIIVAALGAFGGTLGYGYILNAPKNTILPASFIGLAGYIVYILLGMAGFGTMSAYFFSTVFVSVVCELLARKMRTPSTIFLLGALVPLVPGYNFYLAMLALVENLQRRDLDYIEEAEGLQKLMQQYHLSQEQAARRIGKSQSAVANKLRILRHITHKHRIRCQQTDADVAEHLPQLVNHPGVTVINYARSTLCQMPVKLL